MDRKEFLKSATAALAAAGLAPVSVLFDGCAPSAHTIHAPVKGNKVIVPRTGFPDLLQPYNYVRVYVDQYTNPILIFVRDDGEIRAILSTCSHSGCEVKKLPTKFECPCHGSEYDLQGSVMKGPAPAPLDTFVVHSFADRIEVTLEGPP